MPPRVRPAPRDIDDIALPDGLCRVVIPFPPAILSPNARAHHFAVARTKRKYRSDCAILARAAGMCIPEGAENGAPIAVRIDFFPPNRARRDDDNMIAALKSGRDGIADAMHCDDARWRTETHIHAEPRSCVVVTVMGAAQ